MSAESFHSPGGFSVGIPPIEVVDANGNVVTNVKTLEGNVAAKAVYANGYFYANGEPFDPGVKPGGANTQVQFNSSGSLGGSSSLTWNGTTLTAGNISSSGTLAVTGATTQTGVLNLNSVMVEAYSNVSISTNTLTLNLSTAGIFNATLNSNITTVTLSNYPSGAGQAASFILMLTGDGTARSEADPKAGAIIGKALENFEGNEGVIEVVVGRF